MSRKVFRNFIVLATIILVQMLATPFEKCFGQKSGDQKPAGIFDTDDEYVQFMTTAKQAAKNNPELRAMIPLLNDIALGNPIGSTAKKYGGGSPLGLLSNRKIREDIEMVDDQYEQLKDLHSQIQSRLGERIRSIDFSDTESAAAEISRIRKSAEEDMDKLLLPHQTKRLKQIRMQSQLQRRSLVEILSSNPFKADLEISDQQLKELRDSNKEIQADLQREIEELREKARKKLLSKLDKNQRNQIEEMLGDRFEFGGDKNRKKKKIP